MRRAQQQTITFEALDVSTGAELTGLTFAAADLKLTKDGGVLANVAGAVTELGFGFYKVTLTAAEMDASYLHLAIRKTGMRRVDIRGFTTGNPSGKVVADGANTVSTFKTDRTETADNYWKNAGIVFTSGALQGQVREILAYNGTTKFVTVAEPLTGIPAGDVQYNLITE